VFTYGVVPSVLPALLGIWLSRLDENIRSSLFLGLGWPGGSGTRVGGASAPANGADRDTGTGCTASPNSGQLR